MKKIKSFENITKLLCLIIIIGVSIFGISKAINLYNLHAQYVQEQNDLNTQIELANEEQEQLYAKQSNINSPEYIEDIAREKMDMYKSNDTIFIEKSN